MSSDAPAAGSEEDRELTTTESTEEEAVAALDEISDVVSDTTTMVRLPVVSEEDGGQEVEYVVSDHDEDVVAALRPGSALLVVLRGPSTGARFLLDHPEVTVGRDPDSDIFLDDFTVSRKHLVFRRLDDGGYELVDVGSLNGTYVNMEQVDRAILAAGDEVQVGKFRLVYFAARAF